MGIALAIPLLGCSSGPLPTTVMMTDFSFEPRHIGLRAGVRSTLTLLNKGAVEHSFVVSEARLTVASPAVAPGGAATLDFVPPLGAYRFACIIPGHEEAGMVGQLSVTRRRASILAGHQVTLGAYKTVEAASAQSSGPSLLRFWLGERALDRAIG